MIINFTNLKPIDEIYQAYLKDPKRVDPIWRAFFEGISFASDLSYSDLEKQGNALKLINAFRADGYKFASINPLVKTVQNINWKQYNLTDADLSSVFYSDFITKNKQANLKKIIETGSELYCHKIGYEFDHCSESIKNWIKEKVEKSFEVELDQSTKYELLKSITLADIFESFLNTKYPSQVRFSIEGAHTLIPIIEKIIDEGIKKDLKEVVIGMPHRGRLSVLANIIQKPYSDIFFEFEGINTYSNSKKAGDVKYHVGHSSNINRKNKTINIQLSANPSHLESVNPVVLGKVYAKQLLSRDLKKEKIFPILIHGDASFSGQGVVYESMQLMQLENYFVGGCFHIIVNNQIGYTTSPKEGRSTLNCSDIAKTFGIPVFHVNAEDPESCILATEFAMELIHKFKKDVIIDLVCYRKYGHNEGDEPVFTQPIECDLIKKKKSIRQIYKDHLVSRNEVEKTDIKQVEDEFLKTLNGAFEEVKSVKLKALDIKKIVCDQPLDNNLNSSQRINSLVSLDKLKEVVLNFSKTPSGFNLHLKLKKWVDTRSKLIQKDQNDLCIDWSFAEMLTFSTLLIEKIPVRLAGQDSKRGTFNQRHLVWIDQKTGNEYYPLKNLKDDQALFEIVNTPLSEFAALGFEYGYSLSNKKALVLWEAQFGDFCNGAQILIDQYITSAEEKWDYSSSLVLLLPHGYEGLGPEHSSARVERFLQLAANDNIIIANPTTPSQYFHLLREQALRVLKKPLIIFTPKSLLRHPLCLSSIADLTTGKYEEILNDIIEVENPKKLIFCSGKIFYDLIKEREKRKVTNCIIYRIEQLYPLQMSKLAEIITRHEGVKKYYWVQEEPENMGAWSYIYRSLYKAFKSLVLEYIGLKESSTPAVGSQDKHKKELSDLLNKVFEKES